MHRSRWILIGLTLLAGLVAAETAAAQQPQLAPDATMGAQRQRAPGVPLAPQPAEFDRKAGSDPVTAPLPPQRERQARNAPAPRRDPPMPKPVPAIIAP